jgi:MFS family permease
VGPAICAVLIESFGVDTSYYFQGAMYVVAAFWTVRIRIPQRSEASYSELTARQSFFTSMREGFDYILAHRVILALMVLALAPILLGAPYLTLMPIFAVDIFHGGPNTQGLLLTIGGVGAILGALLVATLGSRQGSVKLLIGAAAGYGISLVLFSRSPVLWMAMGSTFLSSACMAQYQSQAQTIIQVIAPGEIRGRVLGVYSLSNALSPLGSLLMGGLASGLGAPWAVTIMGLACFLVVAGVAIFARGLWKLKLSAESEKNTS